MAFTYAVKIGILDMNVENPYIHYHVIYSVLSTFSHSWAKKLFVDTFKNLISLKNATYRQKTKYVLSKFNAPIFSVRRRKKKKAAKVSIANYCSVPLTFKRINSLT